MKPFYYFIILFSLAVTSVHAQPANDDPCNATVVSVNTGLFCPVPPSFTTVGATTNNPQPSCYTLTGDVWFRFTATASVIRVSRNNVTSVGGTVNSVGMVVYRSTDGTCASLSQVVCNNTVASPFTVDLSGLTVGGIYYVRVGAIGYSGSPAFNFTLCVGTPAPVPANDECANAISLNDGQLHGLYTDNATQSLSPFDCGWGLSANGALDGWYRFVASISGPVTITAFQYPGLGIAQPYVNLERFLSCGDSAPADCDDDEDGDGIVKLDLATVAGATYYFRMYGRDATGYMAIQATGSFPLPVGINHFNAVINPDGLAQLGWDAGSTDDLAGFAIERMDAGGAFENVGFDAAMKDALSGRYFFTDVKPLTGRTWYRLRRENTEGSAGYSQIVSVMPWGAKRGSIAVYPNPATDYLKVSLPLSIPVDVLPVTLFNDLGQRTEAILDHGQLNISNLKPGLYQAAIVLPAGQAEWFRFVKR